MKVCGFGVWVSGLTDKATLGSIVPLKGFRVEGFRALGFWGFRGLRVLGFRGFGVWGFRDFGSRGFGFRGLGV